MFRELMMKSFLSALTRFRQVENVQSLERIASSLPLLEEGNKWDVSNSGAAEIWRAAVFIREIWKNCSVCCRVLQGFPNTPPLALTLSAQFGSPHRSENHSNLRSLPLMSSQLSTFSSFTTCYFVFMCFNLFYMTSFWQIWLFCLTFSAHKARCTARPWRPPMTQRTGCPCPPRACGSERTPWLTAYQTCRLPS